MSDKQVLQKVLEYADYQIERKRACSPIGFQKIYEATEEHLRQDGSDPKGAIKAIRAISKMAFDVSERSTKPYEEIARIAKEVLQEESGEESGRDQPRKSRSKSKDAG